MRILGLQGAQRGKAARTTVADPAVARAKDLVGRDFAPLAPNRLWVADFERHEALSNRVGVGDLHRRAVAAAG
jgi:transposase InsO family protein